MLAKFKPRQVTNGTRSSKLQKAPVVKTAAVVKKPPEVSKSKSLKTKEADCHGKVEDDPRKSKSLLVMGALCLITGAVLLIAGAIVQGEKAFPINLIGFIFTGMGVSVLAMRFTVSFLAKYGAKLFKCPKWLKSKSNRVGLQAVRVEPIKRAFSKKSKDPSPAN